MQNTPSSAVVWSATPTPFTDDLSVDTESVARLVEHHACLGVEGLMLAGTCGEGPWMTWRDIDCLTRSVVEFNQGRMRIAVQVTDNSPRRILRNIELVAKAGAEIAVLSAPYFLMNATPRRILEFYQTVARNSILPIGFYDLGKHRAYQVRVEDLPELLAEPNLVLVKDSSSDPDRRAVAKQVKTHRADLMFLNGNEFDCVTYLEAGYDGLLLGGGIFNGGMARRMAEAVRAGEGETARAIQARMNDWMYRVYGGTEIECWMSGLKYLLVRMGLFNTMRNHLDYPLTEGCRRAIDETLDGECVDETGLIKA